MKKLIITLVVIFSVYSIIYAETYSDRGNKRMEIQIDSNKINVKISITDTTKTIEVFLEDASDNNTDLATGTNYVSIGKNIMHVVTESAWTITIEDLEAIKTKKEYSATSDTIHIFKKSGKKYTVKLRKRDYKWKTININPFLELCGEWTAEKRIELALKYSEWPEGAKKGILARFNEWTDSSGKKGSKTREMTEKDILDWMYSGGVKNNSIILDVKKITVAVEKYWDKELQKNTELEKDDHINAITWEYKHKDIMYVILWFEPTLGGVKQCGNLAGMSIKIKNDK